MSRWSSREWLHDIDADELRYLRKRIETDGFWRFVDSQSGAYTHSGDCQERHHPAFGARVDCFDWRHVRGDECLAASSGLTKCAQPTVGILPFCGFHFDRVWQAVSAFVVTERIQSAVSAATFEVDRERDRRLAAIRNEIEAASLELAQAQDAKSVLEQSGERVYFFTADEHVKIGRSRNPERRVKSFGGTLAPEGVDWRTGQLLGSIPGGSAVERALHARFIRHRATGEWFHLVPEVADAIAALLGDAALADTG